MIPRELQSRTLVLPESDAPTIVLLTGGSSPRHMRFGYRMQQEFGERVIGWFDCQRRLSAQDTQTEQMGKFGRASVKLRQLLGDGRRLKRGLRSIAQHGPGPLFARIQSQVSDRLLWRKRKRQQLEAEETVFTHELSDLRRASRLEPIRVTDPGSEEFIGVVRKLQPYFLLALGGPLYSQELIQSARGIALNQHAGWSPEVRGNQTIEWALYHRKLDWIGSTVHVLTTGADVGPILRRSHPCLTDNDTPEVCFVRSVALGTELMIECVHSILQDKKVTVYEQPHDRGRTYVGRECNAQIIRAIYRDAARNWLADERGRARTF